MLISKKQYDQDMAQQRQQLNKQTKLYLAIQDENSQLQAQLQSMKDMLRLEMIKSAAAEEAAKAASGEDGDSSGSTTNSNASNEMVGVLQKEMDQMKERHNVDLDSMLKRLKDKEVREVICPHVCKSSSACRVIVSKTATCPTLL